MIDNETYMNKSDGPTLPSTPETEPYSPPSFPHQKAATDDGMLRYLAERFANLTEAEKEVWRKSDADFLAGCSTWPPIKPVSIQFMPFPNRYDEGEH